MVTLRLDQPVNLVGAFEKPVRAGQQNDQGYVGGSAIAFAEHAQALYRDWLGEPELTLVTGELLGKLGNALPLKVLLNKLRLELDNCLKNGGAVE